MPRSATSGRPTAASRSTPTSRSAGSSADLRQVRRAGLRGGRAALPRGPWHPRRGAPPSRAERGRLAWRRPNRATLLSMLHHPVYAGAYVYGRRMTDPRKRTPGAARIRPRVGPARGVGRAHPRPPPGLHHVGPVRGEPLAAARQQRQIRPGRPAGRRVAARRARPMRTMRQKNEHLLCAPVAAPPDLRRGPGPMGRAACQAFGADPLEGLVVEQVLLALEPASLEVSLGRRGPDRGRAGADLHGTSTGCRAGRVRGRAAPAGRTRWSSRRIASWPANWSGDGRRRWPPRREAEDALERYLRIAPPRLTEAERERIRGLARDVPAIWRSESTPQADRQHIIRHMIEICSCRGDRRHGAGRRWRSAGPGAGRAATRSAAGCPRTAGSRRGTGPAAGGRIEATGADPRRDGPRLVAEGYRSPGGDHFTPAMVTFLCKRARQAGLMAPVSRPAGAIEGSADRPGADRPETLASQRVGRTPEAAGDDAQHLASPRLDSCDPRVGTLALLGRWAGDGRLSALRDHWRRALVKSPRLTNRPANPDGQSTG